MMYLARLNFEAQIVLSISELTWRQKTTRDYDEQRVQVCHLFAARQRMRICLLVVEEESTWDS
jgi:hypothetical protein